MSFFRICLQLSLAVAKHFNKLNYYYYYYYLVVVVAAEAAAEHQ
jgi:hypothetical protein